MLHVIVTASLHLLNTVTHSPTVTLRPGNHPPPLCFWYKGFSTKPVVLPLQQLLLFCIHCVCSQASLPGWACPGEKCSFHFQAHYNVGV